ncbi:GNAT family N-acetyltransferase [Xanthomonas maliensis]|nr:GNAT family N-acetyltransferase [Xanthomonas maliensis]
MVTLLDPAQATAAVPALRRASHLAPSEAQWDAVDALGRHLGACDDTGALMAAVCLTPDRRVERLTVLPAWRRRGLSDHVLAAAAEQAHQWGWPRLLALAPTAAQPVFARAGFLPVPDAAHDPAGVLLQRRLDGPMAVTDLPAAVAAVTGLVSAARRQLLIYTRALDPPLLDDAGVLAATRRFATARHDKQVRVLVQDGNAALASGSGLLRLAQRLPSVFRFRSITDPIDTTYPSAYLVADDAYYFRPSGHRYDDGETWMSGPARSRQLEREFAQIWERSALWNEPRALGL